MLICMVFCIFSMCYFSYYLGIISTCSNSDGTAMRDAGIWRCTNITVNRIDIDLEIDSLGREVNRFERYNFSPS